MTKLELIFDGHEKQVYSTDDPEVVVFHFKDVMTAFNEVKTAFFPGKGAINNKISSLIFRHLEEYGIYTHFISEHGDDEQLCRRSRVIPLEVIVRNYFAGTLADRLSLEEGTRCATTIYDLNYNDSSLGDPMINDTQAVALGIVSPDDLKVIYGIAAKVNGCLESYLSSAGIKLIDFKLEFGRDADGRIMVCDEISPDTSRFWDAATDNRLDKDRFRHDLGNVVPSYEEVLRRLLSTEKK